MLPHKKNGCRIEDFAPWARRYRKETRQYPSERMELPRFCLLLLAWWSSKSSGFFNQDDFHVHVVHLAPVDGLGVADALRAAAVIAVVLFDRTGCLVVVAGGIHGRGDIPGAPDGFIQCGGNLVAANHEIDFLMPEQGSGDAVACSIDIYHLAGFGQAVDRGQEDIGEQAFPGDGIEIEPVTGMLWIVDIIVAGQLLIEAHLNHGFGVTETDKFMVNLLIEVDRGFGSGLETGYLIISFLQRSGCFCQIHCYSTFRYVDYVSITYFICVIISMLIFLRGGRYSCCNVQGF